MRSRLLIYALIALIAILMYLFGSLVTANGLSHHIANADYMNFLLGGAMLDQGYSHNLYSISLQSATQQALTAPYNLRFADGLLPFVSIPLVAGLTAPLYYVPLPLGFLLWDGLQLLIFGLSLYLLSAMLPSGYRYLLWLGAFAFLPLYASLTLGQVSPTLLLGVTLFWWGLRSGEAAELWAGAGLAMLLVKPQLLPVFVVFLLYKRNWRTLSGFIATSVVAYLLSALISGFDWPMPYTHILIWAGDQRDHYGFQPEAMYNLRGAFLRLGVTSVPLLIAAIAIVIAMLIYVWWHSDHFHITLTSRKSSSRMPVATLELQLAAATLAAALTSLHLYIHDLTIIVFSGAVLLGWAAQQRFPVWLTSLLLSGLLIPALTFSSDYDALFIVLLVIAFVATIYLLQIYLSPKEVTR